MVTRKLFSKSLYNAYNTPALMAGKEYLKNKGFKITSSEEDMSVDLQAIKDNKHYFFEVEVKNGWENTWPSSWKDVRIPERKTRLINYAKTNNKKLTFIIFRRDLKAAWTVDGDTVKDCELKEISNRFVPKGEYFYIIPIDRAKYIEL